jgi:beta-mannosidase
MAVNTFSLSARPWRFREAPGGEWRPATVPGCVHTDLRRTDAIPDPFRDGNELALQWIEERDWEYALEFEVTPELLESPEIDLVADGLDTIATVTLNGREIGRSDNMFVAHRWSVRRALRAGRNELRVHFGSAMAYIRTHRLGHRPKEFNDPVGRCQVIRKQQCQFGWDWGPRLVTAGIWRDLRLEAHDGNRLVSVVVRQEHAASGAVALHLTPDLARPEAGTTCRYRLALNGILVARGSGTRLVVESPQLWWPNGAGAQPLYTLTVEVVARDGRTIGQWTRRLGLREIKLDQTPDAAGRAFRFVVNGRALFMKGANWVPAHSFVTTLTRAEYARDLTAARQAHYNMVRVWGGGIYESEDFYDLCDELGLLVWQDFMFACSLYPGDREFLRSVRAEAECQVVRLRHRACLALWCGNNEIEALNVDALKQPAARAAYDKLFEGVLPEVVQRLSPAIAYWPSSPHRPGGGTEHRDGEVAGDTHYWDVWHLRQPVKSYEKWRFRFVSEFGMQSYSSRATMAAVVDDPDANLFGTALENHQKNPGGNQIILDYVSRRYRFPKSQADLIYLSQLNQAHCLQTGIEHYRRLMPHCMGALYWQLNDCWPVASWSSIEFSGRWRMLHHVVRRIFAPAVSSAVVEGDEIAGIGNRRTALPGIVHLHTVVDTPPAARGTLGWELWHVDGRRLAGRRLAVALHADESRRHVTIDAQRWIAEHGAKHLVLRHWLEADGEVLSEDSVFFTAPRFVELPRGKIRCDVRPRGPREAELTFTSPVFQHRVMFDLAGLGHHASDNAFELFPRRAKTVRVTLARAATPAAVRRALSWRALADTC